MHAGAIRQVGSPSQIYEHPVDNEVASFVGIFNRIPATVLRISDDGTIAELLVRGSEQLTQPALPWMRPGDALTLRVRPERLRLEQPGASGSIGLRATVERVVYLGPTVQYLLTASDLPLIASAPNTSGLPQLSPGAEVVVTWAAEDVGVGPA
jgi:ABC-type Fe3+/spermidine/putrescine transport system ATPase subunit